MFCKITDSVAFCLEDASLLGLTEDIKIKEENEIGN